MARENQTEQERDEEMLFGKKSGQMEMRIPTMKYLKHRRRKRSQKKGMYYLRAPAILCREEVMRSIICRGCIRAGFSTMPHM